MIVLLSNSYSISYNYTVHTIKFIKVEGREEVISQMAKKDTDYSSRPSSTLETSGVNSQFRPL